MVALIIALPQVIEAQDTPKPGTKGWWWYEPLQTEPGKEEKEEPELHEKPAPKLSDYTYQRLWAMHPDEFKEIFTGLQKKAVMTLQENDVRDFYRLMDIARRKSLAFANVAAYVTQKYPELNVKKDYPSSHLGRMAMLRAQKKEIQTAIEESSRDFALLYFYSPACHYCAAQNHVNDLFISKYGWQMKPINHLVHTDLSRQFGVKTVPTLILIYKNSSEYITASVGVISLSELEDQLYRSIRILKGDISPQDYSLFDFQRGSAFDINEGGFIEGIKREN